MTTARWDDFEQRVSCEESLYAECEPMEWPPSTLQLHELADRNAGMLAAIAALEERRGELVEDDNPLVQEIMRMDAKLTALVEIVNQLLVPEHSLPPRQVVRFNAVGALLPETLIPSGEGLLLRLRFDLCRSLPLELAGQVERHLGDGRVFVAFAALGELQSDAIERLVFRHHRRKVAVSRQVS